MHSQQFLRKRSHPAEYLPSLLKPRFSLTMIAILVCVVVNALAQTNRETTEINSKAHIDHNSGPDTENVTGRGKQRLKLRLIGFRNGWTNAGLQPEDGIQAIRTAVAFDEPG